MEPKVTIDSPKEKENTDVMFKALDKENTRKRRKYKVQYNHIRNGYMDIPWFFLFRHSFCILCIRLKSTKSIYERK